MMIMTIILNYINRGSINISYCLSFIITVNCPNILLLNYRFITF